MRESTACSDCCCPKAVIFRSGNSLQTDEEKATTERQSLGSLFSITNLMAHFRSASLGPDMLPLTSSTVTRSSGALVLNHAGTCGAFRWIKMANCSCSGALVLNHS
jgi:hypothetical protein